MAVLEAFLVIMFVAAVMLASAALLLGPVAFIQRRRAARVESLNPGSSVWVVGDGQRNRYLVIGAATIAVVDKQNDGPSWSLSRIESATLARMPLRNEGWPYGTGLIVDFDGSSDEFLRLVFPWPGAVGASKKKAMAALARIETARGVEGSTPTSNETRVKAVLTQAANDPAVFKFRNLNRIERFLAGVGVAGFAGVVVLGVLMQTKHVSLGLMYAAVLVGVVGGFGSRILHWRRTAH